MIVSSGGLKSCLLSIISLGFPSKISLYFSLQIVNSLFYPFCLMVSLHKLLNVPDVSAV